MDSEIYKAGQHDPLEKPVHVRLKDPWQVILNDHVFGFRVTPCELSYE